MPKQERGSSQPGSLAHAHRRVRGAVVAVVVFSFFINLLMFVVPIYMLQVYDRVLSSRNEVTLVMLTVLAVGALAVFGLLELVRSRVLVHAGRHLDALLSGPSFDAVFQRTVRDQRAGHGQRLRDLDSVREFLSGSGLIALCDAPWVPLFLGLVFLFHPILGLVALAAAVVIFALAATNEVATRQPLRAASQTSNQANSFVETALRNATSASALGMLGNLQGRWRRDHAGVIDAQARASQRAGLVLSASKALRMMFQVAILGTGAYLVLREETTAGTMIAASIVMSRALAPVEQAVGQWRSFVNARNAYDRLRALLAEPPAREAMTLPAPTGALSVEGVSIVPPGGSAPIVRGVTFKVKPGELFGIIGPSGAGKSTLARALLGVCPVAAGHARIDGADAWDWDAEELGPHLGFLAQDIELFEGTVAENIARFEAVDTEKVVLAATTAGAHEMILRLPNGYDTQVGPGGQSLSGGQKKLVGLARALYGDVRLVVLDEPTANLDHVGEQAVGAVLERLKARGITTIVISHRTPVLRGADRIMVLQEGRVVALGPRDEIMQRFQGGGDGSAPAQGSGPA